MTGMPEEWRSVPGHDDAYEVSNMGRVRSKPRSIVRVNGVIEVRRGGEIKPHPGGRGYCYVGLYQDGNRFNRLVHRLVAQAFLPNPMSLPEVNHIHPVKTDNRAANLEWVTSEQNQRHAQENGLKARHGLGGNLLAVNNPRMAKKLTKEAADQIRALRGTLRQRDIGAMFGVGQAVVSAIHTGRIWNNVTRKCPSKRHTKPAIAN